MIRLARNYATKFIERCPPPAYDTGCTHCKLPEFPPDKQIDFAKNLNGTAASMWKHLLVFLHGVTDFDTMPSKIDLIPGSLANEFEFLKKKALSPLHPVTLSNALAAGVNVGSGSKQKVFLYPDSKEVSFEMEQLPQFIEHYLLPDEAPEPVYNPFLKVAKQSLQRKPHPGMFEERPIEKDLILICGHTQRDVRCGELAPILQKEFVKVLEREKLSEQVDVGLISHIGGHAYAGNVIYFPKNCLELAPVWYGRVFSENVQGIVHETVIGKRIIRELFRGQVQEPE